MNTYIFHIDANNAYLSWTAAHELLSGNEIDLREVYSVIGGDEEKRHGIVLAKSQKAKKLGIKTGMPLAKARNLCPNLLVYSPNFKLYEYCSSAMIDIFKQYSPKMEKFSIDESFMEISTDEDPVKVAYEIKERIKKELGFTVNVGVSTNKLLAKMASDFEKPDKVHTLFKEEIKEKMWHMPVDDLFMCGRKSARKLNRLCIYTIGELAHTDIELLKFHFKSFGITLYNYANGIDDSVIHYDKKHENKGIGNSTTTSFDIKDVEHIRLYLLALCETVATRLRKQNAFAALFAVEIVNSEFQRFTKSKKINISTNSTSYMYKIILALFFDLWKKDTKVRKLGVRASNLSYDVYIQKNFLDDFDFKKHFVLDKTIDEIREKFGDDIIFRACFLDKDVPKNFNRSTRTKLELHSNL